MFILFFPFRKHQLAVESDRRRLLRRCLYEWQVWCRIMREQRCILAQQQETKRKMAALLSAAVKGHLKTKITIANQQQVIQPELGNQSETSAKVRGGQILNSSNFLFFSPHIKQSYYLYLNKIRHD